MSGIFYSLCDDYIIRNDIITPAATAEPMTPDTFGAMACMSRWFDGSYF